MDSAGSMSSSSSAIEAVPLAPTSAAPSGWLNSTVKLSVSSRISSSSTVTRIVPVVSPGSNRNVPVADV